MQPPQMPRTVKDQVAQLIAHAHRQNSLPRSTSPALRSSCTNLDYKQLIQHWYDREPPALRDRKYSMTEFILRFAGRFRPKPATRLIADALRELGWTEHRDWTRAGRNRRYWVPPACE